MTLKTDPIYLETLLRYYEEEIEGEAYFAELARLYEHPDHCEKLHLLAEVERHAAEGVKPLILKHGLKPKAVEDLTNSGRAEARQTPKDWGILIDEMTGSYPGYLDAFQRLEAMGPDHDRKLLSFLTQHEVAAIAFLKLEASQSSESMAPLRDYLNTQPENWVPR